MKIKKIFALLAALPLTSCSFLSEALSVHNNPTTSEEPSVTSEPSEQIDYSMPVCVFDSIHKKSQYTEFINDNTSVTYEGVTFTIDGVVSATICGERIGVIASLFLKDVNNDNHYEIYVTQAIGTENPCYVVNGFDIAKNKTILNKGDGTEGSFDYCICSFNRDSIIKIQQLQPGSISSGKLGQVIKNATIENDYEIFLESVPFKLIDIHAKIDGQDGYDSDKAFDTNKFNRVNKDVWMPLEIIYEYEGDIELNESCTGDCLWFIPPADIELKYRSYNKGILYYNIIFHESGAQVIDLVVTSDGLHSTMGLGVWALE
jgi:hypothetical protein